MTGAPLTPGRCPAPRSRRAFRSASACRAVEARRPAYAGPLHKTTRYPGRRFTCGQVTNGSSCSGERWPPSRPRQPAARRLRRRSRRLAPRPAGRRSSGGRLPARPRTCSACLSRPMLARARRSGPAAPAAPGSSSQRRVDLGVGAAAAGDHARAAGPHGGRGIGVVAGEDPQARRRRHVPGQVGRGGPADLGAGQARRLRQLGEQRRGDVQPGPFGKNIGVELGTGRGVADAPVVGDQLIGPRGQVVGRDRGDAVRRRARPPPGPAGWRAGRPARRRAR